MRTLPPNHKIEFYIRLGVQFQDDKAATSCLLVLGEQSTAWKQTIKTELKADKKQVLVGLASLSSNQKILQLQIELGAAKKSLVRKGIKAWCTKAGLKLEFTGGEPDPEDIDTEEELDAKIDMKESNEGVQANAEIQADLSQLQTRAKRLQEQVQQLNLAQGDAKKVLVQSLRSDIPAFLRDVASLPSLPPNLALFVARVREVETMLATQLAEAQLVALLRRIQDIHTQLTSHAV